MANGTTRSIRTPTPTCSAYFVSSPKRGIEVQQTKTAEPWQLVKISK